MQGFWERLHKDESGQDTLEYALMLAAVAAAAVAGSGSLASTINSAIAAIDTKISTMIS